MGSLGSDMTYLGPGEISKHKQSFNFTDFFVSLALSPLLYWFCFISVSALLISDKWFPGCDSSVCEFGFIVWYFDDPYMSYRDLLSVELEMTKNLVCRFLSLLILCIFVNFEHTSTHWKAESFFDIRTNEFLHLCLLTCG